jgi:outer membrane protein assembly factor BamA
MKFGKVIFGLFVFSIIFAGPEIRAQEEPRRAKQIRILNNYGTIPFEDGKTIITEVTFSGLGALSESDILKALRENRTLIKSGDEFYGGKIAKAVKVVRETLVAFGYRKAAVTAVGELISKNEMRLVFELKTGALARVSEVRFEGNENISDEEFVTDFKACIGDDWQIYDARKYDYITRKCSLGLLFSKGFFQAKIERITPQLISGSYVVTVEIKEGARFRYGDIQINGATVFKKDEILEMAGFKTGEVGDGGNLKDFVYEKLKRAYADKGYVLYNAEFDSKFIQPAAEGLDATVELSLTIDEGKLFKLAKIEFTGAEKEQIEELRKLISLKDGEIYNQSRIEEGIKKINETKKFYPFDLNGSDVEIWTTVEPDDRERVEGSSLLRRQEVDENSTPSPPLGELNLVIKLRKIQP